MSEEIFYDSDCLSSFLVIGKEFILERLFSKIIVPIHVYDELMNPSTPSKIKTNFKRLLDKEFV